MISFNFTYFLVTLLSQIVIFYVFISYSDQKVHYNVPMLLIILVSSVIESIISRLISSPINILICLLYFIVFIKIFLKIKFKEIIFYILIIWLIMVITDISLMLIVNILQNYVFNVTFGNDVVKLVCTIILCLILILFSKLQIVKMIVDKAYKMFCKLNYSYLSVICVLSLYIIVDAISILNINNKIMIIILLMSSISFTISIIKFIKQRYEIITLKETNQLLIKNNDFYIKILNEYRVLKHNLIDQLLGIKSVANKNSKLLIDDIIKEYNSSFKNFGDINSIPSGINGIIYEKIYNFNKKNLKISINNKFKSKILDVISSRSYNVLCSAIGITLDNAMSFALKSKDKIIYLEFKEDDDEMIFKIMNTFKGSIDLDKIGEINYTSKKDGHGLGLYYLFEKKKVKTKTFINNNVFGVEIRIDKINK